jgi:hypothetical protein
VMDYNHPDFGKAIAIQSHRLQSWMDNKLWLWTCSNVWLNLEWAWKNFTSHAPLNQNAATWVEIQSRDDRSSLTIAIQKGLRLGWILTFLPRNQSNWSVFVTTDSWWLECRVTTFPQSWLGTLLYSYAMNGNGHVIIRRHGHIQEQYDQGDIEYVSLCLYGRRTHIRPGSSYHGTVL